MTRVEVGLVLAQHGAAVVVRVRVGGRRWCRSTRSLSATEDHADGQVALVDAVDAVHGGGDARPAARGTVPAVERRVLAGGGQGQAVGAERRPVGNQQERSVDGGVGQPAGVEQAHEVALLAVAFLVGDVVPEVAGAVRIDVDGALLRQDHRVQAVLGPVEPHGRGRIVDAGAGVGLEGGEGQGQLRREHRRLEEGEAAERAVGHRQREDGALTPGRDRCVGGGPLRRRRAEDGIERVLVQAHDGRRPIEGAGGGPAARRALGRRGPDLVGRAECRPLRLERRQHAGQHARQHQTCRQQPSPVSSHGRDTPSGDAAFTRTPLLSGAEARVSFRPRRPAGAWLQRVYECTPGASWPGALRRTRCRSRG